jgi:hypothetical protein
MRSARVHTISHTHQIQSTLLDSLPRLWMTAKFTHTCFAYPWNFHKIERLLGYKNYGL